MGSIRDITDNTGAVQDHINYDGFGSVTSESNATFGDRYKYTGRELDSETGLQFNRARYYDPKAGRWISQDPIGFWGGDANLYRYVGNSPTRYSDPSGRIIPLFFLFGGAAAAWWLLGPGAGTSNSPAPGQEGFVPPPRPIGEDIIAGLPGAVAGAAAGAAAEAGVVGPARAARDAMRRLFNCPEGYTRMQDYIPQLDNPATSAGSQLTPQQAFALRQNLNAITTRTVPAVRSGSS